MTPSTAPALLAPPSTQKGMSLVELMVGLVIGLIITLAITSSIGTIGKQVRITGSGVSAAEGAQLGMDIIDRDIRMAGAAVFRSSFAALCPGINMYKGGMAVFDDEPTASAFAIVRIIDGGSATAPDAIDINTSDPTAGNHTVGVVKSMPSSSSVLKVSEPRQIFQDGDLVLVAHPPPNDSAPCTTIQVTDITGACNDATNGCNINYNSGESEYNPSNDNVFTSPQTYGPGSVLIKMPIQTFTRYAVRCNALLRHDASITPSCTGNPSYRDSAMAGDIVMLKAQYGIAPADSDTIDTWKSGAATTAEEFARIKAIRVAIVARSREPDNQVVTGAAPTIFDGALNLDLSGTSVPSGKTWQNFRYRVHETVTPLRNAAWNR